MVLLGHGCYATSLDRIATGDAQGSTLVVVVGLTVWLALVIEVAAIVEFSLTILQTQTDGQTSRNTGSIWTYQTFETFLVPLSTQSGHIVVHYGRRAAHAFGRE